MKGLKWFSATVAIVPQTAQAAIITLPGPIKPFEGVGLGEILTNIINWLLWLAGALVVIYLIYGGIVYVTAAGNEDRVKVGKSILLNAIVGIIIILVSMLVVTWIKGILTKGTTPGY